MRGICLNWKVIGGVGAVALAVVVAEPQLALRRAARAARAARAGDRGLPHLLHRYDARYGKGQELPDEPESRNRAFPESHREPGRARRPIGGGNPPPALAGDRHHLRAGGV